MKKIIILLLLFVFSPSFSQYDEEVEVSDALQHMLNLRTSAATIVKDYIYKGLKVKYVSKNIDINLANSEMALLSLDIYAEAHPEIKPLIQKITMLRMKGRMMIIHKPDKKKMAGMLQVLDKVMKVNNMVIGKLKTMSNIKVLDYQQAANELEILSQKLAIFYALKNNGQTDVTTKMQETMDAFKTNLNKIFSYSNNSQEQSQVIKNIQSNWLMLQKITANNSLNMINTIYVLTNKISEEAHNLSLMYYETAKESE